MSTDSHRQTLRRHNLLSLLADPQIGSAVRLAEMLGKPKLSSHFSAIKAGRRGVGDQLAMDIEDATGKPRGWMDRHHANAGEKPPLYLVAQDVSHPMRFDDLPYYAWENLINIKPLPNTFVCALPDDAMAPEYPQGTEIVWTKLRRVAPGRLLLLCDQHGQVHARRCVQGSTPGHWRAVPGNPAFVEFDNHASPGLQVLAVFKGKLEPNDE